MKWSWFDITCLPLYGLSPPSLMRLCLLSRHTSCRSGPLQNWSPTSWDKVLSGPWKGITLLFAAYNARCMQDGMREKRDRWNKRACSRIPWICTSPNCWDYTQDGGPSIRLPGLALTLRSTGIRSSDFEVSSNGMWKAVEKSVHWIV